MGVRLALFEPDIPQNTASVIRTAACLGVSVDVVGPCGFVWGDKRMRRAGLDYLSSANVSKYDCWESFIAHFRGRRRILLTTKSPLSFMDFAFEKDDILILGRESAGVPEWVHENVNFRVTIPLKKGLRSLNLTVAAAIVTSEALRQLNAYPNSCDM